jgi:hypothetical protein
VVWGHYNFAAEQSRKPFAVWESLVNTEVVGPWADIEYLKFNQPGAEGQSDSHYLGVMEAIIQIDHYLTGQGTPPTVYYKTGATKVACLADGWHAYNGVSFTSLGWAKLRLVRV